MQKSEATQKSSKSDSPRNRITSEENVHRLEEEAFNVHDSHQDHHHADHQGLNSGHYHHVAA